MKIKLLAVGKTDNTHLQWFMEDYIKRLGFYITFEFITLPDIKKTKSHSVDILKQKEGESILKQLNSTDILFLLDEKGKSYTSVGFSEFLQKQMNRSIKQLVFVIGGPYGFSDAVYARAQGKISLSNMTFSHQMIRLFFVEQLYRAFTILRNEPYHHQ
ncbi:MAG TPA: 23S rRNA (pseudouridine(1915)-N(3))-methyltransferase RlmH [Flavobacteriaceae bacterium]|nr:23S rRNA (pseudouridine(1915)-N(3))-methyltransferase RlmH [Flavobacteriaceae bacterium]